jgi:hypothetical protein
LITENNIETNVDEAVVNMKGNLSLLMGNDNENSNDNSSNTKDTSNIKSEAGCSDTISNRTSTRQKKPPITRKNDFLWITI